MGDVQIILSHECESLLKYSFGRKGPILAIEKVTRLKLRPPRGLPLPGEQQWRHVRQVPPEFVPNDASFIGWDQSHIIAAGNYRSSRYARRWTYKKVNRVHMQHALNAGMYLRVENRCREAAQENNVDFVMIFTFLIYEGQPRFVGNNVQLASHYAKLLAIHRAGIVAPRFEAYVIPNQQTAGVNFFTDIDSPIIRTTLQELEQRIGFSYRLLYNEYRMHFP